MINWQEIIIRLSLAAFLGGLVGLERERKDWTAGLRTHMMVCVGASLTMIVSAYGFTDILGTKNVVLDPSRIAAQVISGIGFIGAGTILFLKEGIIRGLTTASGLWTVAAIGLATGGGMYFAALVTTALAIIILWILQPFEKIFSNRFRQKTIRITVNQAYSVNLINKILTDNQVDLSHCIIERTSDELVISFRLKNFSKSALAVLINNLQSEQGVKEVVWND